MVARNPFENPDDDAEFMAQAAVDEGCPQDFPPAQEARPAQRAPRRRSPEPQPEPQDGLAVQEAYFRSLKPADGPDSKAVQPMAMSFITLEEAAALESSDYAIKRLLPARGVALIYGETGCYKSFTVLSAAVHMSEGWAFGGRRVRKRSIYYLNLEGGAGLGKRIQAFTAWARKEGKPKMRGDFRFWLHAFSLLKWSDCQALCDAVNGAGHEAPPVVVVDTLSQATIGIEENSSEMAEAVGNATKIADAIGGLVILIHHVGKDATKGPRGHSSLLANVDAAIFASKAKAERGADWNVTKSKDDESGQGVSFKVHVFELGLDADGDEVTSCAAEPCRPEKKEKPKGSAVAEVLKPKSAADRAFKTFLLALHEAKTEGVHLEAWRMVYYAKSTADSPNTKRNGFNRARQALVDLGVLSVEDDVYSLTPDFQHRLQADTATQGTDTATATPKQGTDTATHP